MDTVQANKILKLADGMKKAGRWNDDFAALIEKEPLHKLRSQMNDLFYTKWSSDVYRIDKEFKETVNIMEIIVHAEYAKRVKEHPAEVARFEAKLKEIAKKVCDKNVAEKEGKDGSTC